MSKPIIAVFGATGAQGGSVVRHLVAQGRFGVRALTRRPEVYAGPADEAVRADLDDPDSLSKALKGAHGVFLVTDFWQAGTAEQAQATTAVAAARASGVEHLVWSSLPDVNALTNGRRKVPHFTGKARVKPIIQAAGFPSYTFAQPPFYFENLSGMMGPQSMPDGRKGWVLPIDPRRARDSHGLGGGLRHGRRGRLRRSRPQPWPDALDGGGPLQLLRRDAGLVRCHR